MATKNAKTAKGSAKATAKPATPSKAAKAKPAPKQEKAVTVPIATVAVKSTKKSEPKVTPKIMSGVPPAEKITEKKAKSEKKKPAIESGEAKLDPEWVQMSEQNRAVKPVSYSMSEDFPPKSVINHKVLGLGFVLTNQNNRIEVLFKEGKKLLITNYKK